MKISLTLLSLLGLTAAPVSAIAQGPGRTHAEFAVEAADAQPLSTGITVQAGRLVGFDVSGTWCMGGAPPTAECGPPSGIRPADPVELPLILDTAEIGALIGRVGSGPWFEIGAGGAVRMPNSGTLELLFNDRPCCYGDNSGSVRVAIKPMALPRFVWARRIGGNRHEAALGLALDARGNVHTTGFFQAVVDFDPGPGIFNLSATNGAIFVSKLTSAGAFVWAKKMGGAGFELGRAIAVDADSNVYITGQFEGTADFDPGPGVFNLTAAGFEDMFICKLDRNGALVWAKRIGGTFDSEPVFDLAVDEAGNVYTVGWFNGAVDFDPGPGTHGLSTFNVTAFVLKLDNAGDFVWVRTISFGVGTEVAGIAAGRAGDLYLTGRVTSISDVDFRFSILGS
jgi:hypothetical protein